jgi:hypothetical protein
VGLPISDFLPISAPKVRLAIPQYIVVGNNAI